MPRSRILLTLALAAILTTPCAYGAPREERARPAGLMQQVWGILASAWAGLGFGIDPHGLITSESDLGHGIDPHGLNSTGQEETDQNSEGDLGFNIDPHG